LNQETRESILDPLFKRLQLTNARRVWRALAKQAKQEKWSLERYLRILLASEVKHRQDTAVESRLLDAGFPFLRAVDDFDFTEQEHLTEEDLKPLVSKQFIESGNNLVFAGPRGAGKTHLAIAVAQEAVKLGFEARFTYTDNLLQELTVAASANRLREVLGRYVEPDVVVVDELGYHTYSPAEANLLFMLVNKRRAAGRGVILTVRQVPQEGKTLPENSVAFVVESVLKAGALLNVSCVSDPTRFFVGESTEDLLPTIQAMRAM